MKRFITFALAVLLLLTMASCGKKEAEPTVAPTEAPVIEATEAPETQAPEVEPEWEPAIARAAYAGAVYAYLDAGTNVDVIGQFNDYYVIAGDDVDMLVEKDYVRLHSEDAFVSWEGYAKSGTQVYESVKLMVGKSLATLKKNTKVTVLGGKGDWLLIEWDGGKGYVKSDMISKWYIKSQSGSQSGSYAGGGSTGRVDGTGVVPTSVDSVQAQVTLLGAYHGPEQEAGFEGGKGEILLDNTEAYITLLIRGDEVKVTEHDEFTAIILLGDGLTAKVPRWLLEMEGDMEYESWTAYGRWNGIVYEEYQARNELVKLTTNKEITVIDELPICYVVEVDGEIGYIPKDLGDQEIDFGAAGGYGRANGGNRNNLPGFGANKVKPSSGGGAGGGVVGGGSPEGWIEVW